MNDMPLEWFPRSTRYDTAWVESHSLGENVTHFAESLSNVLPLAPGMRVLDLGCGHAVSSIFLAREFGVRVWAVDRAVDPTANFERAESMGCADLVFPIRADVRELPFPQGYFDVAIALDSYLYYGTDERFLPFLSRHIKPGGYLGVVDAYTSREIESANDLPESSRAYWQAEWYYVHSIEWWRRLWERSGLMTVLRAERLPESEAIKQEWIDTFRDDPREVPLIALLNAEAGQLIGSFRLVGQRTDLSVVLEDDDSGLPY